VETNWLKSILSGHLPLKSAVTFLLHCDTPLLQTSKQAFSSIQSTVKKSIPLLNDLKLNNVIQPTHQLLRHSIIAKSKIVSNNVVLAPALKFVGSNNQRTSSVSLYIYACLCVTIQNKNSSSAQI